jgi:hypothetical protein
LRLAALPQVIEQGEYLACDPFDLPVALLIGTHKVQYEMAHSGSVEGTHAVGYLLG